MSISVVIVSWNNRSELGECLQSLQLQTRRDFETILIDNHSNDGTVEMVQTDFPEVVLKEMDRNLGFAEGCNRGIEIATGDWICTLNSDAIAAPDWIAQIQAAINNVDNRVGMFQSKVIFKKNSDRTNTTGIVLLATGSSGDRGFNAPIQPNDEIEEIFAPSACAAAYKREMLCAAKLESGIFDRSFFMYTEDLDLGWRCRLMGWKTYYLPKAIVHHGFQSSSKKWGTKFAELQCRKNRIRALVKNGSIVFLIITFPKTIYDLFIGLRHTGFRIFPEFYKALRDGFNQRKSVTKKLNLSRRDLEKRWVTAALRINSPMKHI